MTESIEKHTPGVGEAAARPVSSSPLHRTGVKIALALLLCLCMLVGAAATFGVALMAHERFYSESYEVLEERLLTDASAQLARESIWQLYAPFVSWTASDTDSAVTVDEALRDFEEGTHGVLPSSARPSEPMRIAVFDEGGALIFGDYDGETVRLTGEYSLTIPLYATSEDTSDGESLTQVRTVERRVVWYLCEGEATQGRLYLIDRYLPALYACRFVCALVALLCAAAGIVCFALLLCAVGHHYGEAGVRLSAFDHIPLDVLTLIYALLLIGQASLFIHFDSRTYAVMLAFLSVVDVPLVLLYILSLATRLKCRALVRQTLIFRALRWLFCLVRRYILRPCRTILTSLPLIPKTALAIALILLLELIVLSFGWRENLPVLWVLEKVVFIPLLLLAVIELRKLQAGGKKLANGDLRDTIDTSYLFGDFRRHAEDLNRVREGMNRAVEEQLKSERLRTELITNVSHDLKTPLTSIINYVDLLRTQIAAAPTLPDPTVTHELDVLDRQCTRLKKLIEDLIEASKASTGNIQTHPTPCELNVLLSQALGEYSERLEAAHLTPVVTLPEVSPVILADGNLLWRVFDNLLGNAVKYALPDTRLYLTLETTPQGEAVLTLRNISRDALPARADELMERFVRGDASRHTSGNGLGLSIARGLTELMGGTLRLEVDGDLFKAILTFPLLAAAGDSANVVALS